MDENSEKSIVGLQTERENNKGAQNLSPSLQSSLANSISQIKLDEISSFGATKQARLPALISFETIPSTTRTNLEDALEPVDQIQKNTQQSISMEQNDVATLQSLNSDSLDPEYQLVDMDPDGLLVGPSLPGLPGGTKLVERSNSAAGSGQSNQDSNIWSNQANAPNSMQMGDSLIDIVVNLRTENQSLVQALQRNNEFVRHRLDEFKQIGQRAMRQEERFLEEKANLVDEMRKLRQQNEILSERLKSMESKLKDMKCEIKDTFSNVQSSKCSSVRSEDEPNANALYPHLDALSAIDLKAEYESDDDDYDQDDESSDDDMAEPETLNDHQQSNSNSSKERKVGQDELIKMTKKELSDHFDANKLAFCSMEDRMKQCDKLEQQLNDVGNRDYEICLLQQQINIYRQDYRLEKMANIEAKIQIEKLKNEIDELCMKRIQEQRLSRGQSEQGPEKQQSTGGFPRKLSGSDKLATAERFVGKMGRQAARSAAKAARYAAKHAHLEEKATAAANALAAKYSQAANQNAQKPNHHHHHHRRSSSHRNSSSSSSWKTGIQNELWDTANKAMMTGYKMASTHVNLALDKLSEFEKNQAAQATKAGQSSTIAQQSGSTLRNDCQPSID